MKTNKIPAYTLMEMVVVMLITTIVISITYTSFRILSLQYLVFKQNSEKIAETALVDRLLSKDFLQCQSIRQHESGIDCQYPRKQVRYTFEETYVLRKELFVTDTFFIAITDRQCFFFGQKVTLAGSLLNELHLEDRYKEENRRFRYHKTYGADVLINAEENNQLESDGGNRPQ